MAGWGQPGRHIGLMSVATVGGGRDRRGWPRSGASVTQSVGYRARVGCSPRLRARKYRTSWPSAWAAWRPCEVTDSDFETRNFWIR